jgi:hypothetical protein
MYECKMRIPSSTETLSLDGDGKVVRALKLMLMARVFPKIIARNSSSNIIGELQLV